ncbi:MAG: hypothetical protein ACRDJB_06015 [Actinomycetota bacterium]
MNPRGLLALGLGSGGGILLGWGLGDAAPFIFFSTEEEVGLREQGETVMLIATAVLLLASLLLVASGFPLHAVPIGAMGVLTTGVLFSPLGGSIAPHVVFLLLAPAAAAALMESSGLAGLLRLRLGGRDLRPLLIGFGLLVALYGFVLATGPIGAVGALTAPFIYLLFSRWLR